MEYQHITDTERHTSAGVASFMHGSAAQVSEYNIIITGTDATLPFAEQICNIDESLRDILRRLGAATPVMARWFLSDPVNQAHLLPRASWPTSIVGQPPLCGVKAALWVSAVSIPGTPADEVTRETLPGMHVMQHGPYRHLRAVNLTSGDLPSYVSTVDIFGRYAAMLESEGCTVADNCMRTWLYVSDIDVNYQGMVKGRNQMFDGFGLTADTHFIASTGIAGAPADPKVTVSMDTYAVAGLQPQQVRYLKAASNLNPTSEYGVAFERATAIDYGDRRHILVSGTASINNKGEVVHTGDVKAQTSRMLENINALLEEGGCGFADIAFMIVYLRDTADYAVVNDIISRRYPDIPKVVVLAPVCRPTWLVEAECIAIAPAHNPQWANY